MSIARPCKFFVLLCCLVVYNLPEVGAQGKSDKVSFETVDSVKIEGTYYPSNKGTKAPCVLLLHDWDFKAGGNSRTAEWDNLASALQTKGYAVLTFDFRGFGQSTQVGKDFWRAPQNIRFPGALMKTPPQTINYKNFNGTYYRQLVNDVAAARAYLDNENDASQLNSRNLIVIGAGQGATVGLMWMDAEFKRHKAQVNQGLLPNAPPVLRGLDPDPTGEDLVAGIWLSINPTLGGVAMGGNVRQWIQDMGGAKAHKLPMAFIYGKDDPADALSLNYIKALDGNFVRNKPIKALEFTGDKEIKAKLVGSKLLADEAAIEFISTDYLQNLMNKRGITQWKARNSDNEFFYWKTVPLPTLAKIKGDKVPVALPPTVVGLQPR